MTNPQNSKVVFLTAGAAGMFCGSCMHDNALAKALRQRGVDCILQPVYTPIRTDEVNTARQEVFFGGIQIYLLNQLPWFRFVPGWLRSWLDHPRILSWATRKSGSTDPASLGSLAISMLRGEDGRQAEEVHRLTDWLADEMRPDVIVLSNLLIGGAIPTIRRRLPNTKLIVLLQGDDIFLDHLPDQARREAIALCQQLAQQVDTFIVNSLFYGERMSAMLSIDADRWVVHPLSIDLSPFSEPSGDMSPKQEASSSNRFRLGYLARIAPEKGLHHLVDAFIELGRDSAYDHVELHVAGWLGEHNRGYLRELVARVEESGLSERFFHHGSPELEQKVQWLSTLDTLCVPTVYEDPKGLFVLEALASGVPVVQPEHGAFRELIESTGGGLLYTPGTSRQLVNRLAEMISNSDLRGRLANEGKAAVHQKHSIDQAAMRMIDEFVGAQGDG